MRLVLVLLAALPLLAAGQFGLRGRVLDGQGTQQIPNAIVTVTSQAGYISSVTTNRDGQFSFASLPAGEYDFRVTVHGYAIYEREVSVAANGGVRELDIRMMVPADKQTVSVNELLAQKSSHPREQGL